MICYHFYNLKNVKNMHEGEILSLNLQAEACSFTKEYHSSMDVFPVYKIVQMVPNRAKHHICENIGLSRLQKVYGTHLVCGSSACLIIRVCLDRFWNINQSPAQKSWMVINFFKLVKIKRSYCWSVKKISAAVNPFLNQQNENNRWDLRRNIKLSETIWQNL